MSASLTEKWCDERRLPTFAALRNRARAYRVSTYMDSLPGSIWTDIPTGRGPSVHGNYFTPRQYFTCEGRVRRIEESDFDPNLYLWADCHSAGLRCAVIDVPFLVFKDDFNGVQIRDLATHDVLYGFRVEPEDQLGDLLQRFGPVPVHDIMCDAFEAKHGTARLHEGLLKRAEIKTRLLEELLAEDWDLFYAVYGESHCAAHYHWPDPAVGGNAAGFERLVEIYAKMDEGLSRVLAAAGPDTRVMVTMSHGVGPKLGGPQLLPEVLTRLGLSAGKDPLMRRNLRTALLSRAHRLPVSIRKPLRELAGGVTGRLERMLGRNLQSIESSDCQAAALWNNRCGAVRFNVKGRDPNGTVAPENLPAVRERLTDALFALQDPNISEPIVTAVDRVEELFPEPRHPDLPDLTIRFRTDLGPLDHCVSDAVGLVHVPIGQPGYMRTGDHTPDNRTYVVAPGYSPGRTDGGSVLDIAPTVLELCGVTVPAGMSGRPLAGAGT